MVDSTNLSLTVLYVITMIVALVGNTLLIYIVWKKPETRNLTSFLFVNMAVADLLVALFQMPINITHFYISGVSDLFCRFEYYAHFVSMIASIFSLTVMAFDRYFAVVHPFRRSIWFRKPKIIMPIIWISSMALMSIAPVAFRLVRGKCRVKESLLFPFYTYFFVVGYLVPLTVISVLYTLVARKLWLHKAPVDHDVSENQRVQEIPKKKVIRMLVIVVVVFAVCWLPLHVYQMDDGVSMVRNGLELGAMWHPYIIIYICFWLSQANSAINPWLYIGLNGKMKAAFKNMIRCRHEEITGPGEPTQLTLRETGRSRASAI
ncbi:substance-K receptor-like [Orbicella faveolata]|uniref:substance-K receptor-like n=1 Tax=Orbicella faveolata TaxID=48498 RepID=UPI0009E5EBC2|nr:substance-K receptor-like [Orbicella faveolata]XP_020627900.1 substance-K receptor-like [Orbicella faveolata]XP_020627901.1 substance-K receptor-like [Orbicella faveolata]